MKKFIYDSNFTFNDWNLSKDYDKSTSRNIKLLKNIIFKWNILWENYINNYTFENCIFEWSININIWDIKFNNCIFENTIIDIKLWNSSIEFNNCNFKLDFIETRNINFKSIFFFESTFKNITLKYLWTDGIYFHDTIFENLNIEDIRIVKNSKDFQTWDFLPFYIEINSNKETWNIIIDGVTNLENLYIWDTRNKWKFWNIEIRNINFLSWDNNSYIINDSNIEKLDLRYCSNFSGKLVLQNLLLTSLYIKNTDLWKTTFNWIKLDKLFLENVTLNDCVFNWVNFPKDYKLIKWKLSNKQLKDTYRQLKHVMDKNSNHTEANNFFEKEMKYELLSNNEEKIFKKWIWNWLKTLWNEDFLWPKSKILWDRVILFLWKIISEFWNNWLSTIKLIITIAFIASTVDWLYYDLFFQFKIPESTPVIDFSIVLGLIIFLIIVIYVATKYFFYYIIFATTLFIYISSWDVIKLFFQYLYPLYGLKFDFIKNLNALEIWSFTVYKILYSILLWHLVVALKRTTKR